mmetsp:Transcript_6032/g.21140  ORF Transcript_6032/g.21140 Transcript_6032/m.21140 type:complete len:205 (-) Transcript_6032:601-1215(-)
MEIAKLALHSTASPAIGAGGSSAQHRNPTSVTMKAPMRSSLTFIQQPVALKAYVACVDWSTTASKRSENSAARPKARMVTAPVSVSCRCACTGERLAAFMRCSSLYGTESCEYRRQRQRPMTRKPRAASGRRDDMMLTAVQSHATEARRRVHVCGRVKSSTSTSKLRRLITRPAGVVSKKSIGARNTAPTRALNSRPAPWPVAR